MLIDRGFRENDVVSLKLISGEEIIARYESEDGLQVKVTKPLLVGMGHNGLAMMPWVFLADKEAFSIQKSHIMAMSPSKKEAADQYMEGTTGLALR